MNKTLIDWTRNPDGTPGYTWNPITGCLNHINGMCKGGGFPCYAYRLAEGRLKTIYLANKNTATKDYDEDSYPFYPRFWQERLNSGMIDRGNKGIFVCDMSDLFGIGIPEQWTRMVLQRIREKTNHRFYLLTKQPQNLAKFSPFPDNCWVGVTATDRASYNNAIWHLKDIQAKVKYLSFEPLLGQTVAGILDNRSGYNWPVMHGSILQNVVNWLIIGAQTRPTVYPKIEWVEEIVEAADKAGIPVFLKDNLKPLLKGIEEPDWMVGWGNKPGELRQEMPK